MLHKNETVNLCHYLSYREALDFVENKAPGENKIKERNVSEEKFKEWELFYQKRNLQVWRKPTNLNGLFEYKGIVISISLFL